MKEVLLDIKRLLNEDFEQLSSDARKNFIDKVVALATSRYLQNKFTPQQAYDSTIKYYKRKYPFIVDDQEVKAAIFAGLKGFKKEESAESIISEISFLLEDRLKYKKTKDSDGDSYVVKAFYNGEQVGEVDFEIMIGAYWYFEPFFSEDKYNKLFPDDEFVNLREISIRPEYRNKGFAGELLAKAIGEIKKTGIKRIYLNAAPVYDSSNTASGLDHEQLAKAYERFGFKPILKQSKNVQMLLSL